MIVQFEIICYGVIILILSTTATGIILEGIKTNKKLKEKMLELDELIEELKFKFNLRG